MPRYTPEQLERRNASVWTKVQGILAPIQFVMFLAGLTVTWLYQSHNGIDNFLDHLFCDPENPHACPDFCDRGIF